MKKIALLLMFFALCKNSFSQSPFEFEYPQYAEVDAPDAINAPAQWSWSQDLYAYSPFPGLGVYASSSINGTYLGTRNNLVANLTLLYYHFNNYSPYSMTIYTDLQMGDNSITITHDKNVSVPNANISRNLTPTFKYAFFIRITPIGVFHLDEGDAPYSYGDCARRWFKYSTI